MASNNSITFSYCPNEVQQKYFLSVNVKNISSRVLKNFDFSENEINNFGIQL